MVARRFDNNDMIMNEAFDWIRTIAAYADAIQEEDVDACEKEDELS